MRTTHQIGKQMVNPPQLGYGQLSIANQLFAIPHRSLCTQITPHSELRIIMNTHANGSTVTQQESSSENQSTPNKIQAQPEPNRT